MTPLPGVLYGITHDESARPIIHAEKVLKVGIGLPKGHAINVWISKSGKWLVQIGHKSADVVMKQFDKREDAESYFAENFDKAPIRPQPAKIPYFTFTRHARIGDADVMIPDWDAIEAHGHCPTSIPIVFASNNPYSGHGTGFRWYSQTELRCKGDGINALRLISLAKTPEEKVLAKQAKDAGEMYFPITEGCWGRGCEYRLPTVRESNGKTYESRQCTPNVDLILQLIKSPRISNATYFHTTGEASARNIVSAIANIQNINDGVVKGVPFTMSVQRFNTNHNGLKGFQYKVILDVEPAYGIKLMTEFMSRQASTRRLEAPPAEDPTAIVEDPTNEEGETITPEVYNAEFVDDYEPPPPAAAATPAETIKEKTDDKTAALAEDLKKKAGTKYSDPSEMPGAKVAGKKEELF